MEAGMLALIEAGMRMGASAQDHIEALRCALAAIGR